MFAFQGCTRHAAVETRDLSCYLAHQELESVKQVITVVMGVHTRGLAITSLDTSCTKKGSSPKLHLQMCLCDIAHIGELY